MKHLLYYHLIILQIFLFPSIYLHWKDYRAALLQKLKDCGDAVVLVGDVRHDSMGHSAKYGAYSIYSTSESAVVHFDLVQVRFFHF